MGVILSIFANHAASVCFHSVPMIAIHTVAGCESFVSIAGNLRAAISMLSDKARNLNRTSFLQSTSVRCDVIVLLTIKTLISVSARYRRMVSAGASSRYQANFPRRKVAMGTRLRCGLILTSHYHMICSDHTWPRFFSWQTHYLI